MDYKVLLSKLNLIDLKKIIRQYMSGVKITIAKKSKEELITHILKHTEFKNNKITIKTNNFNIDTPKMKEPKPKKEPKMKEPKKVEPKMKEPKKVEPKKTEPKKTEPKKVEPKKTEPTTTEEFNPKDKKIIEDVVRTILENNPPSDPDFDEALDKYKTVEGKNYYVFTELDTQFDTEITNIIDKSLDKTFQDRLKATYKFMYKVGKKFNYHIIEVKKYYDYPSIEEAFQGFYEQGEIALKIQNKEKVSKQERADADDTYIYLVEQDLQILPNFQILFARPI